MEKLQSSRLWRKKINEPSMMAMSDYNDVFGEPPWHRTPFYVRLDDYSEIIDATASTSSIPVLDLSMVENGFETVGGSAGAGGCRAGVDYIDIFGSIGGEGYAASYEELFVEGKRSGVSSSVGRNQWDVLSEQQEREASEHSLKVYTDNNEPDLEMNQHSSFPRQTDDVSSKKFSMSYHRMSQETLDNTGAEGHTSDGGQKNEAPPYFPSAAKNFSAKSPESIGTSLLDVPGDENHNSRSYSFQSTSSDAEYLKVSEISLQTKPFKGPPPSRPPPLLSTALVHPKVLNADSRVDVEEGSFLKSSSDSIKGSSFLPDTELDPSSAAAASIAAIKKAMEQAQVRLTSAKKLMDRKRDKAHWKVGSPKAMGNGEDGTVTLKTCSKLIEANVEREEIRTGVKFPLIHEEKNMQLPSYIKDQQQLGKEDASKSSEVTRKIVEIDGELKMNKEYYELLRNGGFFNTARDFYMERDDRKAEAAICESKDSEQAIEVEAKQKSMGVCVCIEKLEKYSKLKGSRMDYMVEANENLADATMGEFQLKNHASELEEDYDCVMSDENQKQSETHKDENNENNANKPDYIVDYCLYEEIKKKLPSSNIDFKPWVANWSCEEDELQAAQRVSGYVEYERKFNDGQAKCEVNESSNYELEIRSTKHQYSYDAFRCKIEEGDNVAEKDEGDDFQTNEEARILVENEFEQKMIQDENGLENGLEMHEAQEEIEDAELENTLNFREGSCCKDCNEKDIREARTALQKDEASREALMNQNVKNSEFLASTEGVCGKRVSGNITEAPVLVETHISSNSADEACQLGEIEESDTGKVFLSGNDGNLLATAPDATEIYHVVKAADHVVNADRQRDRESSKELDRERERERIVMERANYEAHQQVLAEARVREEKIAVERATAEARQRALAAAQQKAGKAAEAEKASREARLRAERAAVQRATEEARKRAIEKALAEKAAADARERTAQVAASHKDMLRKDGRKVHFKATHIKEDSETIHRPTLAAKSLAERNMRDILAQREHVERDRFVESLDGEVRRWSSGKNGNLRSLLSTLQYILGPDSGWQPIPITDIINASAAKKAYRKATLCVHPDKLQQRGASIQQKYICEKVFDLLQEAWNKFNSEER